MRNLFLTICVLLICSTANALDITWGVAEEVSADDIRMVDMAVIDTDKYVLCYDDSGPGDCRVGTVSGTDATHGDENQFNADPYLGAQSGIGVAKVDTDQFVVVYMGDAQDDDGFMSAANVATRTISYGTEIEYDTGDTEEMRGASGIAQDKVAFTYNDEADSDTCYSIVCTNDATPDLTCGAAVQCDGDGTTDYYPRDIDTSKVGTDKWISCFYANDITSDGYCVIGSASGTAITYDVDPSAFNTGTVVETSVCTPSTHGGTADRFVVVYTDSDNLCAKAGTVSTRTITYGAEKTDIDAISDADWPDCTFVTETKFIIAWEDVDNTDGTTRLCSVDWATRAITCDGSEEDYVGVAVGESSIDRTKTRIETLSGFDGVAPKVAVAYVEDADGDDLMVRVGDLSFPAASARRVISIQ